MRGAPIGLQLSTSLDRAFVFRCTFKYRYRTFRVAQQDVLHVLDRSVLELALDDPEEGWRALLPLLYPRMSTTRLNWVGTVQSGTCRRWT